jgi:imidazolonepropionase-like amidohydrolase
VEVLEGRRLVHAHCYRADEILMLLRLADEYGFKIRTLQHVLEGYKVAREIAAHGAGASTFSDWWAYKVEAYDAIPYNAAIMVRKGVLVSLNSDSDDLIRRLNTEAAKAMRYGGLTETEALALVTINPAKQLLIDQRVGSIEPGKDADLAIYDKHPLSNYARVQKVLVDGEVYFDRDRDISGRAEKEARRKVLLDRAKEQQKKAAPKRRPQ